MDTKRINKRQTLMIAHRGVSGLELENTNLAFVAAGNRSYFGIETDVHCTGDGDIIVFHDDTTKRLAEVDLPVEQTDFATLRALDLRSTDGNFVPAGMHMPTLEDYVSICKKYDKVCVLELKNPMPEDVIRRIIDRIEALEYLDRVIFISFSFENLVYVRNYQPEQPVQYLIHRKKTAVPYLIGEYDTALFDQVEKHGFDVDVNFNILTKEAVELFHRRGIRVNCWTVDRVEDAERLVEWGVDYITTNILE